MNIPIIMYHSINNNPDKHPKGNLSFTVDEFELQLDILKKKGFEICSLSSIYQLSKTELLKNKYAVLTFDDGFVDNLNIVMPILKSRGIKATIFINTENLIQTPRNIEHYDWGILNEAELKDTIASGVFDIQSHTHTHKRRFISNEVVDHYTSSKFDKYYWLLWIFFPEKISQWHGDIRRFKNLIPEGFPILKSDRSIVSREFKVSFDKLKAHCFKDCIEEELGVFETDVKYLSRIKEEIKESLSILNSYDGVQAEHVCFPGGAYNKDCLTVLKEEGVKSYMKASKYQDGDNVSALVLKGESSDATELSRLSFTNEFPSLVPKFISRYLSVSLKIDQFCGRPLGSVFFKLLKIIKKILK